MTTTIKPCPFCGGTDIRAAVTSCRCHGCGASGPQVMVGEIPEVEWNRRTTIKAMITPVVLREMDQLHARGNGWEHIAKCYGVTVRAIHIARQRHRERQVAK